MQSPERRNESAVVLFVCLALGAALLAGAVLGLLLQALADHLIRTLITGG